MAELLVSATKPRHLSSSDSSVGTQLKNRVLNHSFTRLNTAVTGGSKTKMKKLKRQSISSYLQGKVLLCYIHCGLAVVRIQVQQMVIFWTLGPEGDKYVIGQTPNS